MLGPYVPAWQALREALDELVRACPSAKLAAVLDESDVLVCWSTPIESLEDRAAQVVARIDFFHERELSRLPVPLRRGGHLSVVRKYEPAEPRQRGHLQMLPGASTSMTWRSYIAESFASYYVLAVWFDDVPNLVDQQPAIRAAVPKIMTLTAGLPPPDGPSTTAGAARSAKPKGA